MSRMSRVPDRIPPGPIKLTYDDYVLLPDDGRRYEVLDGELEVSPAPSPGHQAVSRNLLRILDRHVDERGVGSLYYAPVDVILAPATIVQPDLLFVAAGRESIVTSRAVEGAPDLVIEILSPASGRLDRVGKAALYARYGVEHYWIVDPDARTVERYALAEAAFRLVGTDRGAVTFRAAPFPDLEIDLGRVWL
jgi:Uma2 family endonuclease